LLPTHHAWPPEIDVLEAFGAPNSRGEGGSDQVHINAISSVSGQGDGKWVDVPGNIYNEFHAYGVDWQPDYLTYYIDGQQVGQVKTPDDMHTPMYVLANLAVGGDWAESPGGETGHMTIDHIRAYAKDPSHTAVAQTDPASTNPGAPDAPLMPTAAADPSADTASGVHADSATTADPTPADPAPNATANAAPSAGADTVDASGATGAENVASSPGLDTTASDVPSSAGSSSPPAGDAALAPATDGAAQMPSDSAGATGADSAAVVRSTGPSSESGVSDAPASGTAAADAGATARVSADSWNGNPQFLVYVDGKQVGDAHTATADHAAGQWQDVAIGRSFEDGAHTVAIKFMNDAYGGAGSDRNLYVQSLDVNGQAIAGSEASNNAAQGHQSDDPTAAVMMTNGAVEFHVPQSPTGGDLWQV
jgi:hypothetical protein